MKIRWFHVYLLVFVWLLIFFSAFSTRINFHDSVDYITAAKELADISNSKIHSAHSFVYPYFLSFFLELVPSMLTIKLLNCMWLILIGILLYSMTKKNSVFLIWAFSPLVWYMSIYTSPALPVAFFFLLAYRSFKIWEKNSSKKHLTIGGLSVGLCMALWAAAITFCAFLVLVFFYDKKLKDALLLGVPILATLSIAFLIDWYYYGLPGYSFIRLFGATAVISAGLHPQARAYALSLELLSFIVIVSPLLFYLYKTKLKENKREIILLILSLIIFLRYGIISYLLPVAPIAILLLEKTLNKKKVILHILFSILLIILITHNYFGENEDTDRINDLNQILEDYKFGKVIAGDVNYGPAPAPYFNMIYWGEKPLYILWGEDYKKYLKNDTPQPKG